MKKYLIILICSVCILGCAPKAETILKKTLEKCQSIDNGYYEMTKYIKFVSNVDSMKFSVSSHFKKNELDTIYSFLFNSKLQSVGMEDINLVYTGDEIVLCTNASGSFIQREGGEYNIRNIFVKNLAFSPYWLITNTSSFPLPDKSSIDNKDVEISYIGIENIEAIPCYHIKIKAKPSYDNTVWEQNNYTLEINYDYWINKKDYVPIQFSILKNLEIEGKPTSQFEKFILTKYEFNNIENDNIFTMEALSNISSLREFNTKPQSSDKKLVEVGEFAPDWSLLPITGDTIHLSDLKDNIVLINFFYMSCPPCIEELPHLKKIHEKYSQKGLLLIGVNAINQNKNDINNFIKKYNINYHVASATSEIIEHYEVSAYPTTYLIGKGGQVIYNHIGCLDENEIHNIDSIIENNINF